MSDRLIYLISGPIGVGKSTTSKKLAQNVNNCVLIEGDTILDMFGYGAGASWEERLSLTWEHILALTRGFILKGFNVVIDFVVEEEFDWFCKQLSDLQVTMKYIVLKATEETLIERIHTRGDENSIDRSLYLLNKLQSSPKNQPFLCETTHRQTAGIVHTIIKDPGFIVTTYIQS
ncbi:AAA family ATPase [Rossellomorea oryzaecorticis]|uniref:AAA family ATPase n=1 Tax=Rossellomorea oryzaecorticis TaxID=1396505 RepID=A0ABW8VRN6_9BACI